MDFIATKWAKVFMITAAVQAFICLAFEASVSLPTVAASPPAKLTSPRADMSSPSSR